MIKRAPIKQWLCSQCIDWVARGVLCYQLVKGRVWSLADQVIHLFITPAHQLDGQRRKEWLVRTNKILVLDCAPSSISYDWILGTTFLHRALTYGCFCHLSGAQAATE